MANANEELLGELRGWAKKMGYQNTIPDEVIDESNAFIWRQVIDRVRPKEEIERIRRNILMQQLSGNINSSAITSKEYAVWFKREELKKRLQQQKLKLQELTEQCDKVHAQARLLPVRLQVTAASISDAEERTYLYHHKQQQLQRKADVLQGKQHVLATLLASCGVKPKEGKVTSTVSLNVMTQDNLSVYDDINNKVEDVHKEIKEICVGNFTKQKDIKNDLTKGQDECLLKLQAIHIRKFLEVKKLQKTLAQIKSDCDCLKLEQITHLTKNKTGSRSQVQSFVDMSLKAIEERTRENLYAKVTSEMRSHLVLKKQSRRNVACTKDTLKQKLASVSMKLKSYRQLLDDTEQQCQVNREKLNSLCENSFLWTLMSSYLTDATMVCSNELTTFKIFNLDYNRKVPSSGCYSRDTRDSILPWCAVDVDTLRLVQDTLGFPVGQAGSILRYYEEKKAQRAKLELFSQRCEMVLSSELAQSRKYVFSDLQKCDAWIHPSVGVLRAFVSRLDLHAFYKRVDLWEKMFVSQYMSHVSSCNKGGRFEQCEQRFMEYFRQIC